MVAGYGNTCNPNALRMWIDTPTGALLFVTILINMSNSKNLAAGQTATTNNFDAEIVRLKQERDARFHELDERIGRLMAQNANMNTLRQLNQEQIRILTMEKDAVGKEYKHKIAAIDEKKNDYYCNRISSVHYVRFAAFCDLHPEVLQMWREFRQAEEGGAA